MMQLLKLLPAPVRRLIGFDGHGADAEPRRGALAAFAIRVASAAILFLSHIAMARLIGVHDFGIFTYIWVAVNVVGILCALGFATSVVRFVPEYRETGHHDLARGFLRLGRAAAIAAGIACAVSGWVILYAGDTLVADHYRIPVALGLACIPAFALIEFQDGVGRAQSWIDLAFIPPYIARPLLLLAGFSLAVLVGLPRNAETAVAAFIIACWVTAIGQYLLQKRRMSTVLPPGPRSYRWKLWLAVSLPALLLEGFTLMMFNLDVLLLERFVAPDQIAIYFAAVRTISLISFVHFAVNAVTMPRFAACFARNDTTGIADLIAKARGWTFWPSLAGAAVLATAGWPMLWLFGPEFTSGYPVMVIMIAGFLARAAAGPAQGFLMVTGKQNTAACVIGATVGLNICLNLALIPRYGLIGAAIATSFAFAVEAALLHLTAKRAIAANSEAALCPHPAS